MSNLPTHLYLSMSMTNGAMVSIVTKRGKDRRRLQQKNAVARTLSKRLGAPRSAVLPLLLLLLLLDELAEWSLVVLPCCCSPCWPKPDAARARDV